MNTIVITERLVLTNYRKEREAELTPFEREPNELLKRAKNIKAPNNTTSSNMSRDEYNKPSEIWMNDAQISYDNYLKDHPLEIG